MRAQRLLVGSHYAIPEADDQENAERWPRTTKTPARPAKRKTISGRDDMPRPTTCRMQRCACVAFSRPRQLRGVAHALFAATTLMPPSDVACVIADFKSVEELNISAQSGQAGRCRVARHEYAAPAGQFAEYRSPVAQPPCEASADRARVADVCVSQRDQASRVIARRLMAISRSPV